VGELVLRRQEGSVATITLDSQHNRNALSRQLLAELDAALTAAIDGEARVIVLTNVGPAFCSGADLSERAGGRVDATPMVSVLQRIIDAPCPVIAAVDGAVRAGGVGLMAACDLVVVRHDATFAFTEVRIGAAPAIISVPILQRCGWSSLAAAFLTGEAFDADTAMRIGLVTHVTENVQLAVAELSERLLLGGPNAVAATKRLLRATQRDWDEMRTLSERLFASTEAAEGMRAFAEKRQPAWPDRATGALGAHTGGGPS
jgi:enoyl-CoA hydratase